MSGKFALIIANNEYNDSGLAQLTAPGKDAEDFARVLRDKEIGAFDDVNILLNQQSSAVNEAIDEFFDQKKPDDLLVLYFSGHGVRDELGALYLGVKNTIRTRLRSTAIKSDYIRDVMEHSRSKRQVLILDCCMSGAFAQGTKAATGVSIGTASAFESGYGRIILTASDSTQFAWEGDKVIGETDNSLFTHFLVEGLEGEADLDSDGRITVDELYDYAYEKVRFATPKQTPSKFSDKQQGEIVLRQSTRIENIKPLPLSDELIDEIEDTRYYVREAAVQKLEKILKGKNIGLARSAKEVLVRIAAEDDSRRVSQMATQVLESIHQIEQKAAEEQRAREESERLAMLRAEEGGLAREKAEAERKAREEAEKLTRAKAERETAERETSRLKAEREAAELAARQAVEKAANEKAEKEAAEREADRLQAEQETAREKDEREAAIKAEREAAKLAARKKAERETVEKAEREAMELAARRKAEREATEKDVVISEKTTKPQTALRQQPILTWIIIGMIGLCVIGTGAGVISYLASLGSVVTPAPTQSSLGNVVTPAPTEANPAPLADLVAACKAEGMLSIIATPAGWANYGEIFSIFEAKSGVKINSLDENAGSADELAAIDANKGNVGPQAPDVIDIGYAYGSLAKDAGQIQPYKVSNWDSIPNTLLGLPAKDPEGYWTGGYYGVMSIEINTTIVTNPPANWFDLLKPEYKGQVALTGDPRISNQAAQAVISAGLANSGSLNDVQPGLDFFKQLNDAGNFVPVIAKVGTIAQGATPIVLAWDYNAFGDKDTLAGNPEISVTYPSPTIASMYVIAISAYAPHPNCAKLWMEVLYSDEGQLAWMKGYVHGVLQGDMEARGVIPTDLQAKLLTSSAYISAVSPTPAQLTAARDAIKTGWDTTVGVDVK
jgi:putative spermidine/putrescine transport system substrate-binding protein